MTSTVDFAAGRVEYFNAVRDFLYLGSHTGISFAFDFANAVVNATVDITQYTDELAQDAIASALSTGTHSGISFSYDDVANSLSAAVSQIAFTGLSDVPASYAGQGGKLVTVRTDGAGLQFTSPGTLLPVAATPRFMGAQLYMSASTAALNITAGYSVPFNSEAFDTDGFHDTVTNNTRLTIPAGLGIRRVKLHASVRFSSIAAGSDNYISIRKNGSDVYYGSGSLDAENSGMTSQILNAATSVVSVVDGDWFDLFVRTSDTSVLIEADRTVLTLEVIEVEGGINIVNVQTDASPARTLVMADINACLLFSSGSATTVTVPANASVAFPVGAAIELEQRGTGQVSIVGDVGVTVNRPATRTAATAAQYSVVRLRKTGTNTWTLSGDIA
jgi:hypothetical protein